MRRRRVSASALLAAILAPGIAAAEPTGDDPALWQALSHFSAAVVRAADSARQSPWADSDLTRAEGAQMVMRLTARAIMEEIAAADHDRPFFMRFGDHVTKGGLDNPDNIYLSARMDDSSEYVIRGSRGSTADLVFQIYLGFPGTGDTYRSAGYIDAASLVTDDRGRFEIFVTRDKRGDNWLPMVDGTKRVLVRWTFADWRSEQAGSLSVERLGVRGEASPDLTAEEMTHRIERATAFLDDVVERTPVMTAQTTRGLPVNRLKPLRGTGAGGLPSQYSTQGRFDLAEDQALVVSTLPSAAAYQGFQLGSLWFESLEYRHRQTSLTTKQAQLGSDGRYHFVISARDPGVPNWLDTTGHREGLMLLRWQGSPELAPAHQPEVRRVGFDDVRASLPPDTPELTADDRRQQIARRQDQIQRRFDP